MSCQSHVVPVSCRASRSGLCLAECVLFMHTNCYFAATIQNSEITIKFIKQDFLKESNNLVIRSHNVTLTIDHLTLNV